MGMISFAWSAISVEAKIKQLPSKADRRMARSALAHLLDCRNSEYFNFHHKHTEFLRRHGAHADHKLRKRPLRFIEQEGTWALKKETHSNRCMLCDTYTEENETLNLCSTPQDWNARCGPICIGTATCAKLSLEHAMKFDSESARQKMNQLSRRLIQRSWSSQTSVVASLEGSSVDFFEKYSLH